MPSKKKKKTAAPVYGTCEHFASLLGVSNKDPEKHARLTDENEPGPAGELADFVSPAASRTSNLGKVQ
jgi:hypothetical protein